ncbi:FAD/NAD(P)-binding domain-containing protein [Meredithblackwellia eburnea MCA 4105]
MSAPLQNVVIIGLGIAGASAAAGLAKGLPPTHRVVAITENEYGFWPIGSLRAAVVPGWEDKTTAPVAKIFGKGSRHIVIGSNKVVGLTGSSAKLESEHPEFGFEVPFDYAVIATGSTYAFPARPPPSARTIKAAVDATKGLQADIKNAKSILVLGGGATGIEFAGEVKAQYPSKPVTIATSGPSLMYHPGLAPKLGKNLQSQLESLGAKVAVNSRVNTAGLTSGPIASRTFTLGDGSSVEADYVMIATGVKPNSAGLPAEILNENGNVKVNDKLQLTAEGFSNVFAIGDITDVPESKQVVSVNNQTPILVGNVLASVTKKGSLKVYKSASPLVMVTLGPNGGAGQMFGFNVGSWVAKTIKSKTLFLSNFAAAYPK